MTGYGVPGGLPLIVRFSLSAMGQVGSISQWRTLILVNFGDHLPKSMRCLSRLKLSCASFR